MIFQGHAVHSVTKAMDYVRGPGGDNVPGRATLLGGQGFGFVPRTDDDIKLATAIMEHNARFEMQASANKKCTLDALHVSAAWDPKQRADQDEMLEAGRYFLKSVGMEKSMAIFHRHSDKKHPHMHMVACVIDPKTGLTFDRYQFRYRAQHAAIEWEREKGQIVSSRQPQHDLARASRNLDWDHLQDLLRKENGKIAYGKIDQALALGGHFGPHMVAHRVAFHKHLEAEPERTQKREAAVDKWLEPRLKTKVLDFFDASNDDVYKHHRERQKGQAERGDLEDRTDATTPGLLPPKRNKERGLER